MSKELVSAIEPTGVGTQEPLHPGNQIGLGRFHHQVEMVRHEAERMHLPIGLGTALGQRFQETLPVGIVLEDRLPPITPIHHVVKGSLILHSQLAWHRPKSAKTTASVSIVRTDTFSNSED